VDILLGKFSVDKKKFNFEKFIELDRGLVIFMLLRLLKIIRKKDINRVDGTSRYRWNTVILL
jgi:hypothetical protein